MCGIWNHNNHDNYRIPVSYLRLLYFPPPSLSSLISTSISHVHLVGQTRIRYYDRWLRSVFLVARAELYS
jgi:hypothetical protein